MINLISSRRIVLAALLALLGSSAAADPTVLSVTLSPYNIEGGQTSTGVVTMSGPAPATGMNVSLSSDSPFATVSQYVPIPGGKVNAKFLVSTTGVLSTQVANITAGGTQTARLNILGSVLEQLIITPGTVNGGQGATGRVALSGEGQIGGTTVTLQSDSPFASVKQTVTVPQGTNYADFPITTTGILTAGTATITAKLFVNSLTAKLNVNPATVTKLSVSPNPVKGGANATGTVTLSSPAPPNGATVTLKSNTQNVFLPPSVPIAGGKTTGTFTIGTTAGMTSQTATITALLGKSSAQTTLTMGPIQLAGLSISSTALYGGQTATATATLDANPPDPFPGIAVQYDATKIQTYSTVSWNQGELTATFPVTAIAPILTQSTTTITLTLGGASKTLTIALKPTQAITGIMFPYNSVYGGNSLQGTVSVLVPAGTNGQAITLASNSSYIQVPSPITIPAGKTSVNFFIHSTEVLAQEGPITITAKGPGATKVAALTVLAGWSGYMQNTGATSQGVGHGAKGSVHTVLANTTTQSSPVIGADGTVYVGTSLGSYSTNTITAVGPSGGWAYPTSGAVSEAPALAPDGTIYAFDQFANLYALKPGGALKWAHKGLGVNPYQQWGAAPAIGPDGTIYVCESFDVDNVQQSELVAFNPADGSIKWQFADASGIDLTTTPTIGPDGTIYVGGEDHNLYAVSPDGVQKWMFTTGGVIIAAASVGPDGTVYVGSADHNLYALNGSTGAQIWTFTISQAIVATPAITSTGTVVFGGGDGFVYSLNASSGKMNWSFNTGYEIVSSCAIAGDGTVYVGNLSGSFFAIDGTNGKQVWSYTFPVNSGIYSAPAISTNGTIYMTTNGLIGGLFAIE